MTDQAQIQLETDKTDILDAWLDQCYRKWKKANKWLLVMLFTFCWTIPVYSLLETAGNLGVLNKVSLPTSFVGAFYELRELSLIAATIAVLISIATATVISACFRFNDDIRIAFGRDILYGHLRSRTRLAVYVILLWLLVLPLGLPNLFRIIEGLKTAYLLSDTLYLVPNFVYVLVYSIYIAELICYLALVYPAFKLVPRILVVAGSLLVIIVVHCLVRESLEYSIPVSVIWVDVILLSLMLKLSYVLLSKTRKLGRAMLKRL